MDDRDRWMSCFTDQELLDELVERGVLREQDAIISTPKNPIHVQTECDSFWNHRDGRDGLPGRGTLDESLCADCTILTPPTHVTYSGEIKIEREGT